MTSVEDETTFLRRRVTELREGLDATADALARAHALNREQHRELVQLTMVPPLPFGEDLPARLDAAAEPLQRAGLGHCAKDLRHLARELRRDEYADVRAAVAAALARPTGGDPA